LDLLHRIAKHLRIADAADPEATELAKETPVDQIARDLKEREKEAGENN
jgi:hypothetical protein